MSGKNCMNQIILWPKKRFVSTTWLKLQSTVTWLELLHSQNRPHPPLPLPDGAYLLQLIQSQLHSPPSDHYSTCTPLNLSAVLIGSLCVLPSPRCVAGLVVGSGRPIQNRIRVVRSYGEEGLKEDRGTIRKNRSHPTATFMLHAFRLSVVQTAYLVPGWEE
jgi:hypothetical protein